jgi:hypothetical protein
VQQKIEAESCLSALVAWGIAVAIIAFGLAMSLSALLSAPLRLIVSGI